MSEKTDLQRAVASMMVEARRQVEKGPCQGCDPGNEGAEVWAELVDGVENAVKAENDTAVKVCPTPTYTFVDLEKAMRWAGIGGLMRIKVQGRLGFLRGKP